MNKDTLVRGVVVKKIKKKASNPPASPIMQGRGISDPAFLIPLFQFKLLVTVIYSDGDNFQLPVVFT